jgi:aspartyl-tRNA(Asn)/glutamyl-tRNA(Gln) amidotransferase subunit A
MTEIPSLAAAASLIASGALSPVALLEECLDRVSLLEGEVHAFVRLMAEEARTAALEAESEIASGRYRGPLHGIPIGLKDIFDLEGVATTAHSKLLVDNIAGQDAHAVRKLKDAGAIIVGKLATHEFALGGPSFDLPWPPARNPWDTRRFTGGSSSGTGAAVAAGFVLGGTGSDTGGSIRMPAANCGVAGIKPTYGLVSRHGIIPLAYSLDHAGPLAWTAEDCAILLQAMAGHDPRDPASVATSIPDFRSAITRGVQGLRIGVIRHFFETDVPVSAPMADGIATALGVLRELGAEARDVSVSPLADHAAVGHAIMLVEGFSVHQRDLSERPDRYGEAFRDRMSLGALFTAADYMQAVRRRRELAAEMNGLFDQVDVLVTAMGASEAPLIETVGKFASYDRPVFSLPGNLSGLPSMSLCCGYSEAGLPLSFQIIGRAFDEETVFAVAGAYEQATAWRRRRPAILARAGKACP